MRCFSVEIDFEKFPNMWHLINALDDKGEEFYLLEKLLGEDGKIVSVEINKRYPDRFQPVDLTIMTIGNVLIMKKKLADLIETHGGRVLRFPIVLLPDDMEGYEAVLTLDFPKGMVDLARAKEYKFYDQEYCDELGVPDKLGRLRKVYPLHLNPDLIPQDLSIFRVWEYRVDLIISEPLKQAFEQQGVTGVYYREVT